MTFCAVCPVPPTSLAMRSDLWWCHSRWASPVGLNPCQHTKMWRTAHSTWGQRSLQAGSMLRHSVNQESHQFWLGMVLYARVSVKSITDSISALIMLTCSWLDSHLLTVQPDLNFSLIRLQLCLLSLNVSHCLNILCFPNLRVGHCTDSTLSKYSAKEKGLYPSI